MVLKFITVPAGILISSVLGLIAQARNLFRPKLASLFHWQIIWYRIVMILPFTPNHDGVRLFLPVFPFIACFAGIEFEKAATWLHSNLLVKKIKLSLQFSYSGLEAIILLPCLINLTVIHPYYLDGTMGL